MRAVYAALLVTLVGLPVSAQKPAPQRPAGVQKAAPAYKGDQSKLMLFELRAQQYADRIASAADKGESMAVVDYSMRNASVSLHGAQLELKALQASATPAQARKLAVVAQHTMLAQKAFDALHAELKKEYPSRPAVLKLAYQISDEATLAQGKKPPKHPIIKAEPAKK